jgi:hypothetical protein
MIRFLRCQTPTSTLTVKLKVEGCSANSESTMHYFLDCFLYAADQRILFCLVDHHIPHFIRMNKNSKLNLILNGFQNDDPDYYHLKSTITKAVQTFIIQTQRFLQH